MKKIHFILLACVLTGAAVNAGAQEGRAVKGVIKGLGAKPAVGGVSGGAAKLPSGVAARRAAALSVTANPLVGAEAVKLNSSVGAGKMYAYRARLGKLAAERLKLSEAVLKRLEERNLSVAAFPGYYPNFKTAKARFQKLHPEADAVEIFAEILARRYPVDTVFSGTMAASFEDVIQLAYAGAWTTDGPFAAVYRAFSTKELPAGFPVVVVGGGQGRRAKDVLLLDLENGRWISLNQSKGREIAKQYQARKERFAQEHPELAVRLAKQGVLVRKDAPGAAEVSHDGLLWTRVTDPRIAQAWEKGFFIRYNSRTGKLTFSEGKGEPEFNDFIDGRPVHTAPEPSASKRPAAPIADKAAVTPETELAAEASAEAVAQKMPSTEERPQGAAALSVFSSDMRRNYRADWNPDARLQHKIERGYDLLERNPSRLTALDQELGIDFFNRKKGYRLFAKNQYGMLTFLDLRQAREAAIADLKGYKVSDKGNTLTVWPIRWAESSVKFSTLYEADAYMLQIARQRREVEAEGLEKGFAARGVHYYAAQGGETKALFDRSSVWNAEQARKQGMQVWVEDGVARYSPGENLWFTDFKEALTVKGYMARGLKVRWRDGRAEFSFGSMPWNEDPSEIIRAMK